MRSFENSTSGRVSRLAYWIKEREKIRVAKEYADAAMPGRLGSFTKDPILAHYRFCNVRREDDRVTRWIAKNWRDPHQNHLDLPHAMVVARYINWPDTLAEIGWPEPWVTKGFRVRQIMHTRKERGEKVFTGAYIVSTNGATMDKVDFVCQFFGKVFTNTLNPKPGQTLKSYHMQLTKFKGLGSFMAAQVIADLKYTPCLRGAPDWGSWAAPGPGSLRGLNRIHGFQLDHNWKDDAFINELILLRLRLINELPECGRLLSDLQNVQNCLCEFDKYERVRLGEGKPRATYKPYEG